MPAYPRSQIVPTDEIGIYHCIARCVRRAFLCGVDPFSGRDYEHRKDWIRQRLEQLAAIFAIEIWAWFKNAIFRVTLGVRARTLIGPRGDAG